MIIDSPIISGSYAASGSLNQVGNITITGSLTVTGNITGNITGSATNAVSASFAATATSASYAANATFAISASNALTASYLSNYIPPFPYTGSAGISGSLSVNGNITSTGTLTAQTLVVQTITSSVDFVTGSTHFGSIIDNTHQFTGSVTISGSLAVNGSSAILTNQTGAMSVATASYVETAQTASFVQTAQTASFVQNAQTASFVQNAQTASYVLNAISASFAVSSSYALTATSASNALTASYLSGYVSPFPYTGSAIISGSLEVTGSTNIPSITGSLLGTASFANTSTSASFATTASFALNVPVTASYANNAATASYWSGSIVNAATASFAETASFVTTAQTASFVVTAQTASFVVTAQTASFVQTAQTASYVLNAVSSSFATSASNALTASYLSGYVSPFPFTGSAIISGSLIVTGSVAVSNLGGSGVRYLVADESGSITAQSASAALKSTQAFTSTAGQTTFAVTNGYSTGYVDVFINGSKLATAEFTDTSGTNIVLATGSFSGDTVEVVKYTPAAGVTNNVLRQLTTFTASAGQTVFSASYTPGLLDIFYNGSRLSPSDFTANNGTFFTLATGSAANDILDVLVYSYQVGAFSGIGGVGTANQVAFFDTTNSITSSPNFTISGSTMTVTGSLIVSGSGTFTNIGPAVFSGSLTSIAGFTGSFSGTATSASYAANAELLDGLDSSVFTLTSSFAAQTASFTAFTSSINTFSASILSYTSSINAKTSSFATTGSNTFEGIQTINSNLIVTGSITAQTLVVQTITSSVDFVTGSTRFGSLSSNTHVFTGSMFVTGSTNLTGVLSGTSATFSGNVRLNAPSSGTNKLIFGLASTDYYWLEYNDATGNIGYSSKYSHIFYGGGAGTTTILTLANNGAATFASTLLTGGDITVSKSGDSGINLNSTTTNGVAVTRYQTTAAGNLWGTGINITAGDSRWEVYNFTLGASPFRISNTGISTFSSTSSALSVVAITSPPTGGNVQLNLVSNSGGNTSYGGLNVVSSTGKAAYLTCGDNSFAAGNYFAQASCVTLAATAGAFMKFRVNADDGKGMTIDTSGNIVINNVAAQLQWEGGNYWTWRTVTSGTEFWLYRGDTGASPLIMTTGNVLRLSSLAGSGTRTVTADASGNLSASSDSSLKQEDTTHTIEGLAEVLQLKPRAYKWLSDIEIRGEEATTEIGFFANEVNSIIPSAAPKGNDDLYGFYDRAVIAALVKAIQEQQTLITALQEKLERNNII